MKGQIRVLAFAIVFIAVFMLFFIFDNINKIGENCKREQSETCEKLKGLSTPAIIILLIVGVLSLIVCSVFYILLTLK